MNSSPKELLEFRRLTGLLISEELRALSESEVVLDALDTLMEGMETEAEEGIAPKPAEIAAEKEKQRAAAEKQAQKEAEALAKKKAKDTEDFTKKVMPGALKTSLVARTAHRSLFKRYGGKVPAVDAAVGDIHKAHAHVSKQHGVAAGVLRAASAAARDLGKTARADRLAKAAELHLAANRGLVPGKKMPRTPRENPHAPKPKESSRAAPPELRKWTTGEKDAGTKDTA